MKLQTLARYATGYIIGFTVFVIAIPYLLFWISIHFEKPILTEYPVLFLIIAFVLGSVGIFFIMWSNAALLLKGKGGSTDLFNFAISPRTRHLVVSGPYRFTRNPMVFGAFSLYFGIALLLNSGFAVLALVVFYFFAVSYLKATEEKRLLKDFGPDYVEYRNKVGMIVPGIRRMQEKIRQ